LELTPDSARSLSNYCNALYNIHEYDEGIKYCNQAIEIDPEHSWSYNVLAQIYKRTGDSEKSQHYQNLYNSMTNKWCQPSGTRPRQIENGKKSGQV